MVSPTLSQNTSFNDSPYSIPEIPLFKEEDWVVVDGDSKKSIPLTPIRVSGLRKIRSLQEIIHIEEGDFRHSHLIDSMRNTFTSTHRTSPELKRRYSESDLANYKLSISAENKSAKKEEDSLPSETRNWKVVTAILVAGAALNTSMRIALATTMLGRTYFLFQGFGEAGSQALENYLGLQKRYISYPLSWGLVAATAYAMGPVLTGVWYLGSEAARRVTYLAYDTALGQKASRAWRFFAGEILGMVAPMAAISSRSVDTIAAKGDSSLMSRLGRLWPFKKEAIPPS